ncbi:MAG: hypothetical protein O7H41_11860 [Planctomycetota bacterium]|nr:hypothetical protein [Planctomycetota bacterium]
MMGLLHGAGILIALWMFAPVGTLPRAPQEPPQEEPPPNEDPPAEGDQDLPPPKPPSGEEPPPEGEKPPPGQEPPPEGEKPPPGQEPPAPGEEEPQEPPADAKPPGEEVPPGPGDGTQPPAEEEKPDEDDEDEDFDFDTESIMFVIKKGEKPQVMDMLKAIQKFTGRIVIHSDRLDTTKEINIVGPADLTYPLLRIVLKLNDVELVHQKTKDGREVIKAMGGGQAGDFSQKVGGATPVEPRKPTGRRDVPEMITRIFRLKYADGTSLNNTLRQIKRGSARDPGVFQYDQGTQAFIIRDIRENVDYIVEILEALDIPGPDRTFRVIILEQAAADSVAQIIDQFFLGQSGVPGRAVRRPAQGQPARRGGAAGQNRPQVVADARTNKIIIYALPDDMTRIENLIDELDVRVPFRPGKLHHYRLKDTKAQEIADVLNQVITGSPLQSPGGGAQGGAGQGQRRIPQVSRGGRQFQQQGAIGEVETRIVPDPQTNTLIIQAEPEIYSDIEALIAKLDRKKNQIFIEAQIWEVGVDDTLDLGVELTTLDRPVPGETRGGALTNFGLTTITVDDPNDPTTLVRTPNISQGLTTFILEGAFDRVPFILNALARSTHARILSTPFALTNDNSQATFSITDTVPFATSTVAGTGLAQGGFSFSSATTTLQIEPTISSENRLQLDIVVDIQTFTGTSLDGAPPPSNSRRYEGTVTVPDRKYVVVGGLEQEEAVEQVSKVPFLGDIPLIGLLFQTRQTIKRRTRIFFFIKPTIFSDENFTKLKRQSARLQYGLKKFSTFDYDGEVIKSRDLGTAERLSRIFEPGQWLQLQPK